MPIKHLLQRLVETYMFVVLAALLAGILFPVHAVKLAPYSTIFLAIYLVGQFFTEPNIVIPVVLSVLPWSLLIIPYKYLVNKKQQAL